MSLVENQVISNQLQAAVVGKKIKDAVVNQNPHTFVWLATEAKDAFGTREMSIRNASKYGPLLIGKTIDRSEAHEGWNYLYVGERILLFNIPTRYYAPGEPLPKRHQLLLTLEDGTSVVFCGSLGGPIFLFKADTDGLPLDFRPAPFPSVLSDAFTADVFLDLIARTELKSLSAKAFLATKNRIPGLDNYILHEILWEAGVNPKSKMAALAKTDYLRMYEAIKKVFPAAVAAGGLDTQKDIYGRFGGYPTKAGKNTLDMPCPRCSGIIKKESYLGGAVYYCPDCQPLREPAKVKK